MDLAIEAYISRVNQCSCGDTCIDIYKGADAGDHREVCDSLLTFLKGSKTAKDTLNRERNSYMLGSSLCRMSAKNIWLRDCLLYAHLLL